MNLNPSFDSVAQTAHAAIGAGIFVAIPVALWAIHPQWNFCYGHPKLVGNFIGHVYAAIKEFVWDEDMEDAVTRGSNWRDFIFYCSGMWTTDLILWV
jgi:hypothetical protein